jgi:uncharacterized membrane protein YtjA (UPF0391 family)
MLYLSFIFYVLALISAIFGFGGVVETTAWIGNILFFVFLLFSIITLLKGLFTKNHE